MNSNRFIILPILAVIGLIFFGWSTVMAQNSTIQRFTDQINQINSLPAGTAFNASITDTDATAALQEYLDKEEAAINEMIKQYANANITISDPKVSFADGRITLSVKAGISILKINASIVAAVALENGRLVINTESVKVPVITLEPATVNSYLQPLLDNLMSQVSQSCDIQSFSIGNGTAAISAVKK